MGGHHARMLDGEKVSRPRQEDEFRLRDAGADLFGHGRGGGRVVAPGDDQGRRPDAPQHGPEIHLADGLAGTCVAGSIAGDEVIPDRREDSG